jgi:hypothetical protein
MAHGHEEVGASITQTLMAALGGLDTERVRLYVDLAMSSLGEATRNALEALMQRGTYEYQSEFARKYVAQGREEGLKKGVYKGERAALLEVLDARGLAVDKATRQRIMACTDLSQLKGWLRRAVTAESAPEIFEPAPVAKPAARKVSKRGRSLKASKPRSKR